MSSPIVRESRETSSVISAAPSTASQEAINTRSRPKYPGKRASRKPMSTTSAAGAGGEDAKAPAPARRQGPERAQHARARPVADERLERPDVWSDGEDGSRPQEQQAESRGQRDGNRPPAVEQRRAVGVAKGDRPTDDRGECG